MQIKFSLEPKLPSDMTKMAQEIARDIEAKASRLNMFDATDDLPTLDDVLFNPIDVENLDDVWTSQ